MVWNLLYVLPSPGWNGDVKHSIVNQFPFLQKILLQSDVLTLFLFIPLIRFDMLVWCWTLHNPQHYKGHIQSSNALRARSYGWSSCFIFHTSRSKSVSSERCIIIFSLFKSFFQSEFCLISHLLAVVAPCGCLRYCFLFFLNTSSTLLWMMRTWLASYL